MRLMGPIYSGGIPHACGGEPSFSFNFHITRRVFPTRVGVNRPDAPPQENARSIPHACGGEPGVEALMKAGFNRIPHACGGEPSPPKQTNSALRYSPRVWG